MGRHPVEGDDRHGRRHHQRVAVLAAGEPGCHQSGGCSGHAGDGHHGRRSYALVGLVQRSFSRRIKHERQHLHHCHRDAKHSDADGPNSNSCRDYGYSDCHDGYPNCYFCHSCRNYSYTSCNDGHTEHHNGHTEHHNGYPTCYFCCPSQHDRDAYNQPEDWSDFCPRVNLLAGRGGAVLGPFRAWATSFVLLQMPAACGTCTSSGIHLENCVSVQRVEFGPRPSTLYCFQFST
jgi:hypothetical protein